jgi:DNA-binding GntR family transcriptional regulator
MAHRGGRHPAKYRQIAGDLRARIERGEWVVGDKMPTQAELSARYDGAAVGTIDKALGVLRELGMAETRQGMGTFVLSVSPSPARAGLEARVSHLTERVEALEAEVSELRADRRPAE